MAIQDNFVGGFDWTGDAIAQLKKLWATGMSAGEIAGKMGCGLSRNAIVGKVHRLGLSGRNRMIAMKAPRPPAPARTKPFTPPKPAKPARPAPVPRYAAPVRKVEPEDDNVADGQELDGITDIVGDDIPIAQRRTILSIDNEHCHWPVGDPASPEFFFCGAAVATRADGKVMPYCAAHCRRAFNAAQTVRPISDEERHRRRLESLRAQHREHARAFGGN